MAECDGAWQARLARGETALRSARSLISGLVGSGSLATAIIGRVWRAGGYGDQVTARLAAIVDSCDDAIIGKTLDGEITSWNAAAERMYGYRASEVIGAAISILVPPGREDELGDVFESLRRGERVEHLETTRCRNDGRLIEVSLTISPIRDRTGRVVGASTIARDITERKRAERVREQTLIALRDAEERFRRAFDEAPIGMALVGDDAVVEQANSALAAICGRTRGDLKGLPLRKLLHPADREAGSAALRALADGDINQIALEVRFIPVAGSAGDVLVHGTRLRDHSSGEQRLLCQFQDVTDRKRFEAQLQFMADHDPLTGLLNRRRFEAELDRHIEQVKRYGPEGALLVLDIDQFKSVNDTLGHNAGDELIVSIAGVLRGRMRSSDVLARLGGDEFGVLLPKADHAEAAEVAGALVAAVRVSSALLGGQRKRVTISIGVAMFDGADETLSHDGILLEADSAMYDAKDAGRDGYMFYATSEHRMSRTKARLAWVNRLEHALENDRFALVAQPILELRSRTIRQYELLVWMLDDRDELIPPAAFLYIAERFGLIAKLDEWVARRAINLIAGHPWLQLEVNISGKSLGDPQLLQAIDDCLRATGVDPSHLIFEVTETGAVANITHAQAFAQHLRDRGCRFALDDFGAGFGSFYYLKHLPFDYVKIDGEFIQHAATGRIDQLVIEAVVRIARGLGKETIAECVTNSRIERVVTNLGVDYAQGYHIGQPRPVAELIELRMADAKMA